MGLLMRENENEQVFMEIIKILIVDDEESNLSLLDYVLRRYNYKIDKVNNGIHAIDKYISNEYDVVLLDVMMPVMDGIETCIRMNEFNSNVPIILLTALNDDEIIKKGFDAGAWDYITKPWSEVDLISRIQKANKIYNAEKKNRALYDTIKREHEKQKKEIQLAIEVQNYFLPKWMIHNDDVQLCSTYIPSVGLGGDIYDFIPLGDQRYLVYIGDISGHGVQAALMMTAVKSILKMIVDEVRDSIVLSEVISRLNTMLAKNIFNNKFLTILIGIIDIPKREFTFYNAGHPPFLIINTQTLEVKKGSEIGLYPIGWNEQLSYSSSYENVMPLEEGMILMFYTDGVIESPCNENECLSTQGLINMVSNELSPDHAIYLPYIVKDYLRKANFNIAYDDFTILCVSPQINETKKQQRNQVTINIDTHSLNSIIQQVLNFPNPEQLSQSINIYFKNVISGFHQYLLNDIKENLSDNLILIEIVSDEILQELVFTYKKGETVYNETDIKKRLAEIINDPLFTSSSNISIHQWDDLIRIEIQLISRSG